MSETRQLETKLQIVNARKEKLFTRVQTLFDLSKQVTLDPTKLPLFFVRIEEITDVRTNFESTLEEICSISLTLDPKSTALASMEKQLGSFDELYFHVLSIAEQIKSTQPPVAAVQSGTIPVKQVDVRLPKIELKAFDGNLQDWPVFYDNFRALVHDNAAISMISKFHYLISALSGTPLGIVRSLPLTENNYPIVWNSLVTKYQNKRLLGTNLLDKMYDFRPLYVETAPSLHTFLDTFYDSVTALKAMNITDMADFVLLYIALRVLPEDTRKHFEREHIKSEIPTFDQLITFIREQVQVLEVSRATISKNMLRAPPRPTQFSTPFKSDKRLTSPKQSFVNSTKPQKVISCSSCKQNHFIYSCSKFREFDAKQRRAVAQKLRLCFNCLRDTHMIKQCNSKVNCLECGGRHHTLLHFKDTPKLPSNSEIENDDQNEQGLVTNDGVKDAKTSYHVQSGTQPYSTVTVLLGTAEACIRDVSGTLRPVRILIDSASQLSFITTACVRRLGLTRNKCYVPVVGLGHTQIQSSKGKVDCVIQPRCSNEPQLTIEAVILPKITSATPTETVPTHISSEFKALGINLADTTYDVPGQIDFLLGADMFPVVYNGERIKLSSGGMYALGSIFGWIVTGQYTALDKHMQSKSFLISNENPSLDVLVKQFWESEEPPSKSIDKPEDMKCESLFKTQHYRDKEGRYVVPLPFKDTAPELGDSYKQAASRLQHVERRLENQIVLQQQYKDFMTEYEALGHMCLVGVNPVMSSANFIPHHSIVKENSSSTSIRVVFDASMKTTNHQSLNDILYTGPKLQREITDVVSRFRCPQIVFSADISKMYRQILIIPEHRQYQHILWRHSSFEPIAEYELKTVTYGISAAPYLALRTIQQLIIDEGHDFPEAAQVLKKDMYVDDILTGSNTIALACDLQTQLIQLLARGGFQLRKWSSNDPQLLNQVPSAHSETPVSLDYDGENVIKILGLHWNPTTDCFCYSVSLRNVIYTKRGILSTIARIYDPLGWITPVIFFAKSLLQQLWCLHLEWDESLPVQLCEAWRRYLNHLPALTSIKIPRLILPSQYKYCQLLGFCDASQVGYAAVVYLRVVTEEVQVHLLMAKSRVAPLKTISVPRLELNAAYLLSKLIKYVRELYEDIIIFKDIFAFTDSMIVLAWLRLSPHHLKTFVANRVSTIQDSFSPSCWHHVDSTENPADCASRGMLPHHIEPLSLWWKGPSWLRLPLQDWPNISADITPSNDLPEIKSDTRSSMAVQHISSESMLEKYSSLSRLLRITAWCLRFAANLRNKLYGTPHLSVKTPLLQPQEIANALQVYTRQIQREAFAEDIALLSKRAPCSTGLQRLHPFLDPSGLLRVGGRLRHASIEESAKHPLILPKSSRLTHLLIDQYHLSYLHAGPRALLSFLRRKFWIISARNAIKQRLANCVICLRHRAMNKQPLMGDLPPSRVQQGRPFLKIGIDFGGPFMIKRSKGRNPTLDKAYLCLFICMATKAVHLEVVSDMSSAAFLAAFHRFTSRRGCCTEVFTDNGTNFKGTDRYLAGLFKVLTSSPCQEVIHTALSMQGIKWNFNPPSAPHFGGIWEAAIRSVKYHIRRVIGDQTFTYEELDTIFHKIEAILNSRPLCALSSDCDDFDALTPGHFLVGAPLVALPEENIENLSLNRLSRWQLLQQATQSFWRRWKRDYLNTLQLRHKWTKEQPNIAVGDLVLIKEENLPPLQWRLGRISQIHPGQDGVVRVVTVRTASGMIVRPVVKICPLPNG